MLSPLYNLTRDVIPIEKSNSGAILQTAITIQKYIVITRSGLLKAFWKVFYGSNLSKVPSELVNFAPTDPQLYYPSLHYPH